MTHSAVYAGTIRHRRFAVRRHELRHRIAMAYVDLDELPQLFGGRLLARRPGLVRFRRGDYLGDPAVALADAVRDVVAERTGSAPRGPIRVLCQLRTFGHCFNPVSFYYCYDRSERLEAVVAEVTNTPWGERHAYVVAGGGRVLRGAQAKAMRVSPFMGSEQQYRIAVGEPGATLSVHIESVEHGRRAFDATLSLRRRPLTAWRLPGSALSVVPLIYGHALVLRLKGVRRR